MNTTAFESLRTYAHNHAVGNILVGPHKELPTAVLYPRAQSIRQIVHVCFLLVEKQRAAIFDRQDNVVVIRGQHFGCLHPGQGHIKPFGHHGGSDHKDDQQNQHHVHKGRDVDIGNKIVVGGRCGHD